MKKILFLFIAFYAVNLSAQDNDTCLFSVKIESSDWINPIGELDACYDFDLDAVTDNPQNDSLFEWTYFVTTSSGIETVMLSEEKSLTHKFPQLGTYPLRLRAVDKNGCVAYDSLKVIYDNPGVEASQFYYEDGRSVVPQLLKVCASDTITIIPGFTSGDYLTNFFQPISWDEVEGESFGDGIYLPDGSGDSYETKFEVSGFEGITYGVGDSIELCVKIEHSYLGDLAMSLSSPNGTEVQLFDSLGATTEPYWLGIPNDNDYLAEDTIRAGKYWKYCWSMDSEMGIITNSLENSTRNTDASGINTGLSLKEGTYKPAQDFSGFNGDSVKGPWILKITDYLEEDNGFIAFWSLVIKIEGETELDDPKIIDFKWDCLQEPLSIVYPETDSTKLILHPKTSGVHTYVMTVIDNHGCDYQKEFELDVFTAPIASSNNTEFCDKKVELQGSRFLDQGSVLWEVISEHDLDPNFDSKTSNSTGFEIEEFGPYQLKFTDLICETSDTLDIEFTQKVAELTYEPLVRDEMETIVKAKSWADDGQWGFLSNQWGSLSNKNAVFTSEDSLETLVSVSDYGYYLLTYTGCDTTIAFNILFMEDLSVSNVITPNGDGDNDFFTIKDLTEEYYSYSNMSIFNRLGVEVYRNGSYGIDGSMWDGQSTHQNDELPNGAYFYVLKVGNKVTKQEEVYKGAIQLYR